MANDSNWDTYSEPPKKGMGVWAKVSVGCGALALLLLGSCVGLTYWATHSGKETIMEFASAKMSGWVEAPWSKLAEFAEAIKTDEGAIKLYEEKQRIAEPYPSKEAFLKQAKAWRRALSMLPAAPSADLLRTSNFELSREDNTKFLKIRYKLPDETWITLSWQDDELVGIDLR